MATSNLILLQQPNTQRNLNGPHATGHSAAKAAGNGEPSRRENKGMSVKRRREPEFIRKRLVVV